MLPLFLDFLTIFFIVSGCLLLWLNLRSRPRVIVNPVDDPSDATRSSELLKTGVAREARPETSLTQEDINRLYKLLDEVVSFQSAVR